MNNLKKRDQYIQEELKPWSDHDSSLSGEEKGHFSISGFKGNSYNDGFDDPDNERAKKFRERYMKPKLGSNEMISMTDAMEIAWEAWKERDSQIAESEGTVFDYTSSRADFDIWWNEKYKTNENMIPKQPCPKVKCNECGEEVCDNINFKIGHLYNKHNCKPSVGDYKAKRMMVQYFTPSLKEGLRGNLDSSDQFISDTLDDLGFSYEIGTDEAGNDGVFITDEKEGSGYPVKFEIYSTHPNREHSGYHVTYYTRGYHDSMKTLDLKSTIQDIMDLE